MAALLGLLVAGVWFLLPLVAFARTARLQRELHELRDRLARLERTGVIVSTPEPPPRATPAPAPPAPAALPATPAAAPDPWVPPAAPLVVTPSPRPVAATAASEVAAPREGLEDRIGSVWFQNAGAVVLLLGVFFFILWGYSTGRFGPQALIATGIAIGLASAWRGDRLARSLPRLGHTFIGVGLGVVYLSLYLGHFTLHVMPWPVALAALLAASFATVLAGLRYRVAAIAAIGVVGAFMPPLLASVLSLKGFSLEPPALLGYVAAVDVLVFALTARAGWSALDVTALVLTLLTWGAAYPQAGWGWPVSLGLALLFTALGLAPLPRLTAVTGRVRAMDLAVVAVAPAALIVTLGPWLAGLPGRDAALWLAGAGAVQLAAAAWVDTRRPERDLWRPLTGAAVVFFTSALQHAVGDANLALTWTLEGLLLVLLGLAPRSGWLRLCGHAVTALGVVTGLVHWASDLGPGGALPVVHVASLRQLALIGVLLVGAWRLARSRDRLYPVERWFPELWTLAAHVFLLGWTWHRAAEIADALEHPGGRWWRGTSEVARSHASLHDQLFAALVSLGWFAQATLLAVRGARQGRGFLRGSGHVVALFGSGALLWTLLMPDPWNASLPVLLHAVGVCELAALTLALVMVVVHWRRRAELSGAERHTPEAGVTVLLLLVLCWSAREADHVARALLAPGGPFAAPMPPGRIAAPGPLAMVRAALTSAAWLTEAILMLALGWRLAGAYLRWAGLALIGLTLAKFVFSDLASADVFWRFLTAIAAGAAMLAISYFYQRRVKRRRAAG